MQPSNKFNFERNKIFASNNQAFSALLYVFVAHFHTFRNHKKSEDKFSPFLPFFHTLMLHFLNLYFFFFTVFTTARKFLCFRFLLLQLYFSFSIAFLTLQIFISFSLCFFLLFLFYSPQFFFSVHRFNVSKIILFFSNFSF